MPCHELSSPAYAERGSSWRLGSTRAKTRFRLKQQSHPEDRKVYPNVIPAYSTSSTGWPCGSPTLQLRPAEEPVPAGGTGVELMLCRAFPWQLSDECGFSPKSRLNMEIEYERFIELKVPLKLKTLENCQTFVRRAINSSRCIHTDRTRSQAPSPQALTTTPLPHDPISPAETLITSQNIQEFDTFIMRHC